MYSSYYCTGLYRINRNIIFGPFVCEELLPVSMVPKATLLTLAVAVISIGTILLGNGCWLGKPFLPVEGRDYEQTRRSGVKQPINTWSSLSFALPALIIALSVDNLQALEPYSCC